MGISQADSKPEGRIPTLIGIIKRLVFEDPIIGLLCLIILFPVGYAITSNAITGDIDNLPILLGVEAAVVALCIPLIITKTWKNNQRDIAKQKSIAIQAEAQRRVTREEHRQARIDELMAAKIRSLEAQTTYILDRSDRHERQMLVDSIKEVKALFQTNEQLANVQGEYDNVIESLDRIEGQLGTRSELPAAIDVKDTVKMDETDYQTLYEQKQIELANERKHNETIHKDIQGLVDKKQAELENMRELNEGLSDEIIGQKDNIADVKAEGGRLQSSLTELATNNDDLKSEILVILEEKKELANRLRFIQGDHQAALQIQKAEKLAELPGNQELVIQSEKLASKVSDVQQPEPSSEELQAALEAVEGLKDEVEEEAEEWIPPNCWKCPNANCGRFNNLKQNRCPKCASSKPILTTNA